MIFTLTPSSQTITMHPDMGGEVDFCQTTAVKLTAQLHNATSSPVGVTATDKGTMAINYMTHGTSTLTASAVPRLVGVAPASTQARNATVLNAGASVTFPIGGLCFRDGSTGNASVFPYDGSGDYRVRLHYHYGNVDADSNEVTIHAD